MNKTQIANTYANRKVVVHVLFLNDNLVEVVDSFIGKDAISTGFKMLEERVEDFISNSGNFESYSCKQECDPGCNLEIFSVQLKDCKYQLNIVELN